MNKNRLWAATAASTVLAIAMFATAIPAHAADAVQDNGDGTATVTWSGGTSIIEIGPCSGLGSLCYSIINGATSGSVTISEGDPVGELGRTVPLPAGVYDIKLKRTTTLLAQVLGVRIGSGGGGGTSSGTAASTPVEVSLSLDLAASGASCREGSAASGLVGTWLTLPGAADCTSTTAPSAKLLGWATKADFPVEIAQRQINNGWGAYELFNEAGQMTAVFIPAGGATFVSASTSLHPIWAI